jgi:hypothetical protein
VAARTTAPSRVSFADSRTSGWYPSANDVYEPEPGTVMSGPQCGDVRRAGQVVAEEVFGDCISTTRYVKILDEEDPAAADVMDAIMGTIAA